MANRNTLHGTARRLGQGIQYASSRFILGDNIVTLSSFWLSDSEPNPDGELVNCVYTSRGSTSWVPSTNVVMFEDAQKNVAEYHDNQTAEKEVGPSHDQYGKLNFAHGRDYQYDEEHVAAYLREYKLAGDPQFYQKELDIKTRNKKMDSFFHIKKKFRPYFTTTVSLINIMLLIFELIYGKGFESPSINPMLGPPTIALLEMGGKWAAGIIELSQWWRLFVAVYLHTGLIHLALNSAAFIPVSYTLERKYGSFRILPIYILSGVAGNIVSCIFLPDQITVGASGAIYGYYGILFVDLFKNWKRIPHPRRSFLYLFGTVVISFAFGLAPGFDNFSHISGFLIGIISGIIILPSLHIGRWNIKSRIIQVLTALPILIALFVVFTQLLYRGVHGTEWCNWCRYLSCMPIFKSCSSLY
ncbi:uncharacterized protein LOC126323896 [Schistocerca gregaria]|uniref:uncharacterized protein LOC126323896 n=1 Tax=Schistocerca gregaria TaxID=7010 RepID=UPI00211F026C|nr:uncharacterized protein LOC126323896 [Schistocerca gregaria]